VTVPTGSRPGDPAGPPAGERAAPALLARGLGVSYGSLVALEGVDFEVPYGSSVAVLGPNGSGKSTLFAAAVGVLRPSAGLIAAGPAATAWLPQHLNVEPTFPVTVRDVVRMGRWGRDGWLRRMSADDRRRIEQAIGELGIAEIASRRLHTLSGGQRQRALLAQVSARDAGLILLDEPLTGVDRPTGAAIKRLIADWRGEGRTVMVATHDLEAAAREYDFVLALNRRMVAFGPAPEVCTEPILRETFSGHVARLGDEVVDTSHHHPGAA
jgi:ABC-type Mn2+/Zn2+ transport system ATPase subunit